MFSAAVGATLSRILRTDSVKILQVQAGMMMRNTSSEASSSEAYEFKTLKVTRPRDFVVQVELNRPQKLNAMNSDFWREIRECFSQLTDDEDCRAVVLSGAGKVFTAGLDMTDNTDLNFAEMMSPDKDVARKAKKISPFIKLYQESFSVIERCPKPVIAAIHNACVGGGIDMVSACDIRYCSSDAWFTIKEVDIGLAADVGTLQRFPKIVGNDSLVRELAYTARKLFADEAKSLGFVSRIFPDRDSLIEGALEIASTIASKSPVAVQGTKVSLVFSRDHSVQEGLDHIQTWNRGMLQSEDLMKSIMAGMKKEAPVFSKL